MPRINQYTRQQTPRELINVQASAGAFGGDTTGLRALADSSRIQAQSTERLGQALQGLGNTVQEIKLKRDKSDYLAKLSAFELENMKREQELREAEFESDDVVAQQYVADFELRSQAFAESVPGSMRDAFQQDAARMRKMFMQSGMSEQARRIGVRAKLNFENTIDNATNMVTLDPSKFDVAAEMVREQISSMPGAGIDKDLYLDSALDGLRQAKLNTVAQKSPNQFLSEVKSGAYGDVPDLARYVSVAERTLKAQEEEAIKQAQENRFLTESRIDLAMELAETPEQINQLFTEIDSLESNYKKYFGESEAEIWANDYRVKLIRKSNQIGDAKQEQSFGFNFIQGQQEFNPYDNEHKKALDSATETLLNSQEFQNMDVFSQNKIIATKIVGQNQYVPNVVKNRIRRAALSEDPEQITAGIDLLNSLELTAPYIYDQLDNIDGVDRLMTFNDLRNQGQPINQKTIETVNQKYDPKNRANEEFIKTILSQKTFADYRKEVSDLMSSRLAFLPFVKTVEELAESNPVLNDDLNYAAAAARTVFERKIRETGGNTDAAKQAVKKELSLYGVSRVNPKVSFQKYPPEHYYGINDVDPDWIREQAIDFALKWQDENNLKGLTREFLQDNLFIQPHPTRTAETAKNGKPEYSLVFQSEDGILLTIPDFFKPDQKKATRALVENAVERRKRQIKRQNIISEFGRKSEQDKLYYLYDKLKTRQEIQKTDEREKIITHLTLKLHALGVKVK